VPEKEPATQVVKNIRRATRRHFSAEDKIRIVLEEPPLLCTARCLKNFDDGQSNRVRSCRLSPMRMASTAPQAGDDELAANSWIDLAPSMRVL